MIKLQLPQQSLDSQNVYFKKAVKFAQQSNFLRAKQQTSTYDKIRINKHGKIVRKKPLHRFNSDPAVNFAAKNTPVDTTSIHRNVTFFQEPLFDDPNHTWKDFGYLKDPRLAMGGYVRTSLKDPLPLSRNLLTPCYVAAMGGGYPV